MAKRIDAVVSSVKALCPLAWFFLVISGAALVAGLLAGLDAHSALTGHGLLIFSGLCIVAVAVVSAGTASGRKES